MSSSGSDDVTGWERIMLRVPPRLKHRVEIDAGVHRCSVNARIEQILEETVPAYEGLTDSTPAAS